MFSTTLRIVNLTVVFALTTLCIVGNSATAASFQSYAAAMHAYFSYYRALPIRLPTDEEPGDIYLNPYEGFLARKKLCFAGRKPSKANVVLLNTLNTQRYAVKGTLNATLYKVADVSAKAEVDVSNAVELEFSNPTISRFTQADIAEALKNKSGECAKELKKIRQRSEEHSYQERVPWILRDVISATITSRLSFRRQSSTELKAELEKKLRKNIADLGGSISGSLEESGTIILVTKRAFPVAFRPAFISLEDVDRLKALDDPDFWHWLRSVFFGDDAALNQLQAIKDKFPDVEIARPSVMYKRMESGKSIELSDESKENDTYLEHRNLLLAASWELYREP